MFPTITLRRFSCGLDTIKRPIQIGTNCSKLPSKRVQLAEQRRILLCSSSQSCCFSSFGFQLSMMYCPPAVTLLQSQCRTFWHDCLRIQLSTFGPFHLELGKLKLLKSYCHYYFRSLHRHLLVCLLSGKID